MMLNGLRYIQVALSVKDEKTLERELKPLNNIKDHFPKILITFDFEPVIYHNGIKQIKNHKIEKCTNEVEPGCEWVLEGEGWATEKMDGTCCLIQDGKIYRRYDYKKGRILPHGAIPCQEKPDPITGHFPHWLLCTKEDNNAKYYLEAFNKQNDLENGTCVK